MDQTIMMNDISAAELQNKIKMNEDFLLLDVREPYEFEEFNLGALLIPLGDLKDRLQELKGRENDEIIVHCRSGNRSAAAKVFLIQNGFSNVRSLSGGIVAFQELSQA
jgi:rhodanese-related sulfurtransferase